MPELPDVTLYIERLKERVVGQPLVKSRYFNPFILRTSDIKAVEFEGLRTEDVLRVGKRIVLAFENEYFIAIHLMIAGRFTWSSPVPSTLPKAGKFQHASWDWPNGRLSLSEFSSKKRAGVHLLKGREALEKLDRGGLDVFNATLDQFSTALKSQNGTLKRILTSPAVFDGIGNAYSDEILFQAKISPVRLSKSLTPAEIEALYRASRDSLSAWTEKLQKEIKGFPKPSEVTAFRPDFYVHGRFGEKCRVCGSPVQRIVYAENETNYCARCQNEGRILADRSLSRLLKDDWPRSLDEQGD